MSAAVRKQILKLEREQAHAINCGDIRGATRMFDRQLVGFSSTRHKRIRGLGALAKTLRYYRKAAPGMTYHMAQPQVHVSGETAIATFYWTVRLGPGRRVHGRATHVFVRKGKDWRVIHEHFSRAY